MQEGPLDAGLGWSLILSSRLRTLRQRRLYPSKTQTSSTTSSSVRRSPPDSSSRTTRVFLAANWAGFTALFGRQDMTVGKSAMMPNGRLTLVLLAHPWIE